MDTPLPKSSRNINIFNLLLILTALVGIFLILTAFYLDYQRKILSFYISPIVYQSLPEKPHLGKPERIIIEEAQINVLLQESEIIDGIWEISEESASYLKTSAKPGGEGNIVIYGHNRKNIFANLIDKTEVGQLIEVETEDGNKHFYEVKEIKYVKPSDIEVVQPTDYEVLTVYTCAGFLNSQRFVLKAYPAALN